MPRFAADLRRLRENAGSPGYRELARQAHYAAATLSEAAAGRKLPTLAVTLAYVTACGGDRVEWEARWHATAAELASARPADGADGDAAAERAPAPYKGLAAFQASDSEWLFGRDRLIDDLIARLRERRCLAVFGASGSGKSSALRAGVVPRFDRGPGIVFTPGSHPLEECAARLARFTDLSAQQWHTELEADPRALHRAVLQILADGSDDAEMLVVVDQFEEAFTLCEDPRERSCFIRALLTAAQTANSRVRIVLGIRADFYARCADHPDLIEVVNDSHVLVGAMTADELRQAIVRPAAKAGCAVEGALLASLIAEAADRTGALPLVSHTLLETWKRRSGTMLTLTGYQASGGIRGSLTQTAERVYGAFTADWQRLAKSVLLRLVALGEHAQDARRRVPLGELDVGDPHTAEVLDRLVQARLLTVDQDTVEIAHEVLIRAWPRLQQWLSADREGLRIHRQLGDAARSWLALGRDPGALYRGAQLAVAREWAARGSLAMTALERAFLAASVDSADRERAAVVRRNRQLRYLVVGLSVLLVAAVGAGAIALVQRRDAVAQRQIAISRQLAAESLGLAGTEPGTAVLLAVQAYRTAPTVEARGALLSMSAHRGNLGKLLGHTGAVSQLAFGPDGDTLVSVGRDRTLSLWDTGRRSRTAVLTDHDTWLTAAAVSPDGRTAATGGDDNRIALWDLDRRTRVATIDGITARVQDIAFSPDGSTLATAASNEVTLWDVRRRTRLATLSGHTDSVRTVAFHPDGRLLASAAKDSTVVLWNLSDLVPAATLSGHVDGAFAVAFSPDGSTLATGGGQTTAIVWDTATRTRLATHTHDKDGVITALAFSPDGRTLATAGDDTAVLLWDTGHRLLRARLTGPRTTVYTLAFSPRTSVLAAGGEDGAIHLWDVTRPTVTEHAGLVGDVAFSPDGRTLATAGINRITLWNTADRTPRAVLTDDRVLVNAVAFSPDGRTLAAATQAFPCCPPGTAGNDLTLWDVAAGAPTRLAHHTGAVLDLAFSPDGRTLATASVDHTVVVWDTTTHRRLVTIDDTATVNGVEFSPDGRLLATAGHEDNLAKLWDAASGALVATLAGHTGWVRTARFSPDGRTLATASHDQTVILWDVATHARLATIADHTDSAFTGIAFSPDGRTLAYTSGESTAVLWSLDDRTAAARLTGHTDRVHALAFSPDGRTLATTSADRTLIVRDAVPEQAITHLCTAIARDLSPDEWRRYLPSTPYAETCEPG